MNLPFLLIGLALLVGLTGSSKTSYLGDKSLFYRFGLTLALVGVGFTRPVRYLSVFLLVWMSFSLMKLCVHGHSRMILTVMDIIFLGTFVLHDGPF